MGLGEVLHVQFLQGNCPLTLGMCLEKTGPMQLRDVFIAIMATERLWRRMLLRNLKGPLVPKVH